jgi:hypothetical protein
MKIPLLSLLLLGVAGCSKPIQRFVPLGDNAVLDTKTGRACNPYSAKTGPVQLPLYYDLFKGKD